MLISSVTASSQSRLTGRLRRFCTAEKFNLISDVGDCGSKKCLPGYDGTCGGVRQEPGVRRSVFVLVLLAGICLQWP